MITEGKVTVGHIKIKTEFFPGSDCKFIFFMLGLNGATANYACAWYKIQKDDSRKQISISVISIPSHFQDLYKN